LAIDNGWLMGDPLYAVRRLTCHWSWRIASRLVLATPKPPRQANAA